MPDELKDRLEYINEVFRQAGERRKWRMRGMYFMIAVLVIVHIICLLKEGGLL